MTKRTAIPRTKKAIVNPRLHKKKNKPASIAVEERMLDAVAKFLRANRWRVLVIGGCRVEQPIGKAKFNYQFSLNFTGVKIEK